MNRTETRQLNALHVRVERWREQRGGKRARIPEELWSAAVEVARVAGVYATVQATRFDYYGLKGRMALAESKETEEGSEKTEGEAFIELPNGAFGGSGKTVVELVGRRGERMRIDVSGTSPVDIVGLAQAFWRHEP